MADQMDAASADAPLPLSDLKRWLSNGTYKWLEEADREAAELKQELEDNAAAMTASLFDTPASDDDDGDTDSARRVHQWSSSVTNPDGIFDGAEEGAVSVVYLLSDALAGFGDQVWASSRHVSNLLANADTCLEVLEHFYSRRGKEEVLEGANGAPQGSGKSALGTHPLQGVNFLELGAGAGVPSWTAMGRGARVVCTDQPVADRVRCIAECMERNWRNITKSSIEGKDSIVRYGEKARACPYDWGTPIDEVVRALDASGADRFDVVVAADCVYMPWLHSELLESIDMLMSERGVALLPFALHGNTDDSDVWGIVDRAKKKGFVVDTLEKAQLTPQKRGMDAKQALVHTVRLIRR